MTKIKNRLFLLICLMLCLNTSQASVSENSQSEVFIFVSSSMPEASLVQWMREAADFKQGHAALILRGFINDSLIDTRAFVSKLNKAASGRGGVSIDPLLFQKYAIKEVPAVVVTSGNDFDVVYGNTSLSAALQVIGEKGDTAMMLKNNLRNNGGSSA